MGKATSKASSKLLDIVIAGIEEKKGVDIAQLDLRKISNAVSDFFVICHGNSNTQVKAIADAVVEEVWKATGEKPWHKEGLENAEWILLDFVDVVVHIFQKDAREFYNLEDLWADAHSEEQAERATTISGN
ncbi:MAG: ribosome silencing factor [Bacteroidota bacterium]